MAIICPTITATDEDMYSKQIENVKDFSKRIHIDLMDGQFAPTKSPALDRIWWPKGLKADIHLMYQKPMDYIDQLIELKPRMIIVHNEAEVHHMYFAARLHERGIKAGLALLQDTPVAWAEQIMHSFDQILIFSGELGYHGGSANLDLLEKVKQVKHLHPEAEIAWDGGINNQNAKQLVDAGVKVLNVGGYIQDSLDPISAYDKIKTSLKE
jgi:ribulose-phosphate 3-epimerase